MSFKIRLKTCIINFSIILSSILFSVFLAEFTLRLLNISVPLTGFPGKSMIIDEKLGWRLTPNAKGEYAIADGETFNFKYNSDGLFDKEYSFEKPIDTFRIITSGDSFTWGEGAKQEESYPKQLEKLLSGRISNIGIEVINFGVPKYYTKNQKTIIKQKALNYHPDLIIVSFMSNDIIDAIYGLEYYRFPPESLYSNFVKFLLKRSTFFRLIFTKSNLLQNKLRNKFNWYDIWNINMPQIFKKAWQDVFVDINEIADFCKENNIKLVIVYFPQYGEWTQVPQYGYDRSLPNRIFSDYCRQNKISFLNGLQILLQDIYNKEIDPMKLYWPKDGHFNALGYSYIANHIAEYLLIDNILIKR